jgi:hypothetical protein
VVQYGVTPRVTNCATPPGVTTTHRCDAARFTRLQADAFATHLHQLSGDSTAAADTPLSVRRLLLEVRLLSYSPTPLLPYSPASPRTCTS